MILAIDPGPEESAWVVWTGERLQDFGKEKNADLLQRIRYRNQHYRDTWAANCVIEQVASYGMPVGAEVFETVFWSGRFCEAFTGQVDRMPRLNVKLHLCHDSRAKDGNIRQAILDRFGGKEKAIGKKSAPGPLYGVSGDVWAALAVALTWYDQQKGVAAVCPKP